MKQIIKKLAIVLSVALVCAPMGAMAANKLIVKKVDGTTDAMVVDDRGYIGIGSSAPTVPIHIIANGPSSTSQLFFHNKGRVAVATDDNPAINLFRNNDISVNNGLPRNNDRLGHITFGSEVAGVKTYIANILANAEGDWNTVAPSGYLSFQTKNTASLYPAERVRITSTGSVGIGTTLPKSKLHVVGIVEYADRAAAIAAGLTAGAIYRTGDVLKIVY